MKTKEKIDLLMSYRDKSFLANKHFIVLKELSFDDDSYVRSLVASLLVNFINDETKQILLRLAGDKNKLVRLEAYEALASFINDDVQHFLENSTLTEKDDLARSYAIMAWADVTKSLEHNTKNKEKLLLIQKSKENDDDCLLSISYAQYQFGNNKALEEVLGYLKHKDPGTRFSALTLLNANKDNEERIKDAIMRLLEIEDDEKVKDRATKLLMEINNLRNLELLEEFDQLEDAPDEYLPKFELLSYNEDSYIKCKVARFVINYVNDVGKEILLRLAQDKEASVRTEAYDSLSVFSYDDVEIFLEKAMEMEKDDLARCFVILSWADVVYSLNHISTDKNNLLLKSKRNEKSDHCLLSFCYAQYVLGHKSVLNEILGYLNDEDYQIRCSVLNLLKDIIDDDNRDQIRYAIEMLLENEDTVAVKDTAIKFLEIEEKR